VRTDREFWKAFLKSVKHGRVHKFLKFIFIVTFLYFSFLIGKELISFYREQKKITEIQYKDISLSYRDGNLIFKAGEFFFKKPELQIKTSGVEISLRVWESIKNFEPDFSLIKLEEIEVEQYLKKKKRKYLPELTLKLPFYAETVSIGKFKYSTPEAKLDGNSIYIGKEKFQIGSLDGTIKGTEIHLKPLKGKVENNELLFFNLEFSSGSYELSGKGRLRKDLSFATFDGSFKGKGFKVLFNLRKSSRSLESKGTVRIEKIGKIEYSFRGELGKELKISRGRIIYQEIEANFSGRFNFQEFSVGGKIRGKEFKKNTVLVRAISGTFSAEGSYKEPLLRWNLIGKELESSVISLKNLSLSGEFQKRKLNLAARSDSTELFLNLNEKEGKGSFKLKKFNIDNLKPVSLKRKKYGKWIPSVTISGNGKFKLENLRPVSYSGSFTVDRFFFRGLSSSGTLTLKGTPKNISYSLFLSSDKERLTSKGIIDLKQLTINASFSGENLEVSSLDFLKKIGLEGRVIGKGKLWGKLKNPEGAFVYSSENFSFRGVSLGSVRGNVALQNFYLSISGKTERENIVLNTLRLHIKKPMEFLLDGKVESIDVASVEKILKSLKVEIPATLAGDVTGNFSIYSSDIKKLKDLSVSVNVSSYNGEFSIDRISGTVKDVAGSITYNSYDKLNLEFSGSGKTLKVGELSLKDGEFKLILKDRKLHLLFTGLSSEMLKKSDVSGSLNLDFNKREIGGNVKVDGVFEKSEITSKLKLNLGIDGNFESFMVKVDGNLTINYPYLESPLDFEISGTIEEPKNIGNIALKRGDDAVRILLFGDKVNLVGVLRHANLKFPGGTVYVKMAFVNVDLKNLSGDITVPAFDIKPEKFYKLYSISGLYIKLNKGKPEISGCRFSYMDGWIEFSSLKAEENSLKGNFLALTGVKGLIYLTDLKKEVRYMRGYTEISGSFNYGKELNYSFSFSSTGIDARVNYVLEKISVINLKGNFKNGKLTSLFAEINAGDGNVVVNGDEKEIVISVSEIPVGQPGLWKSIVSGNVIFRENRLTGKLNLTKTRLFFNERKRKEEKQKTVKVLVDFSIDLYFADTVTIKGSLFSLRILPKLKLQSINEKLVVSGSFYVVDGKIDYMGKKFKVLYGTGVIDNILEQKGTMDILATSYISGYYIYMHIKGSFKSPKLFLSSDPPLTREQILNLIMTGASPEQVEESSELFPAVQVAYYATAYLFKPIEKQFREVLRLENFSIEPYITKYGETVVKITLVKKLSEKVRIIGYETTGQRPEYGGSIRYFLTDRSYLETKYNSYYGPEFGVGFELNVK
jgi:translocation and assembly module TamB